MAKVPKTRRDEAKGRTPGRPLVIGGTASGVGKTSIALGLMGAFRRRGLRVAPFKVGPDYIDPGYHNAVAGLASRNLDTWLTSAATVREIYQRASAAGDISIVEGVMGLFDGRAGADNGIGADGSVDRGDGSTAQVARLIGGAVVLVVDCARMARSLAPLLAGFAAFNDGLDLAGAILNNVGSSGHGRMLEAAADEAGVAVLGVVPRQRGMALESRHLGLVPAAERGRLGETLDGIISLVEENVDLDSLASLAGAGVEPPLAGDGAGSAGAPASGGPGRGRGPCVRLAVARDQAFSFYYQDSLEELERAGAILVPFSPLDDGQLPACDGVYLGGGFPEMFARDLEANVSMRRSVRRTVAEGLPLYAECGGLVYLCDAVEVDGRSHRMAGVIPAMARMEGSRQALGYVKARARRDSILLERGGGINGHEFHWSSVHWTGDPAADRAYDCLSSRAPGARAEGFIRGSLLASYVHIHFAGYPQAARRFVAACAGRREVSAGAVL